MKKTDKTQVTADILGTAMKAIRDAADSADTAAVKKDNKYDPSKEKHQKIYGPPASFGSSSKKEEDK